MLTFSKIKHITCCNFIIELTYKLLAFAWILKNKKSSVWPFAVKFLVLSLAQWDLPADLGRPCQTLQQTWKLEFIFCPHRKKIFLIPTKAALHIFFSCWLQKVLTCCQLEFDGEFYTCENLARPAFLHVVENYIFWIIALISITHSFNQLH